ncbi:MAG: hypothetical protein QOJ03_98 [Frankiaceae bacterium]|nr:hypothetical protein [Frankiaceae bacterium]
MARFVRLLAAVALAAGVAAVSPASAAPVKSYQAPFKVGATGGDQFSYHSANSNGTVTVARVYPIPGVINCTKGGPYARLTVQHKATRQVRKVVVSYSSAAVDNFTFLMVGLRDGRGHWYGTKTVRGFVAGSGSVTLLPDRQGGFPRPLIVEFGLQQSSACPDADEGTIQFTKVQVYS